jgi:adenylate cyclase
VSTDEVVDISETWTERRRRRTWLRVGLPIGGVVLVVVAMLVIAITSEHANRAGALRLSNDLLADLQDRIAEEVTAYFVPATRAARLARNMAANTTITDPRASLEAFALSALQDIPQIDALYAGDQGGNFVMVQRNEAAGTDTKLILNAPGPRRVQWIHRAADGTVAAQEQDPTDNFDPRTRGWYQGALKADDVFWTGVYRFFTGRVPGITAAVRFRGDDNGHRVFGVDITLSALSDFLTSLKIGRSGRAAIVDETGHLVAAAHGSRSGRDQDGPLVDPRLDQLDDPALTAAYDRFRVEGYGRRTIAVNGQSMVSIASPLAAAGRDWSLFIVVPEKDFTGFVANNARTTLWLSLTVVALTSVLAVLLVRQGLRADRVVHQLLGRGQSVEKQTLAFAELCGRMDMFDPSQEAPLRALTAMLAELAAARRASIWRVLDDGRLLQCQDSYDSGTGEHVAGLHLLRSELPRFFAALESGEEVDVPNAASDRRTDELHRALMRPREGRALHVLPVRAKDRVAGAIILEDAETIIDVREFMALVVNLLAIRVGGDTGVSGEPRVEATETAPVPVGDRSFVSDLIVPEQFGSAGGADVFPTAAVMVVQFSDAAALAARDAAGATTIADLVAATVQDVATAHNIPYAKMTGPQAILAAGLAAGDTTAIARVADTAIAIRERCLDLLESIGHPPSFQIGIDCGVAVGGHIGQQPRLFNLWGAAVDAAELLAQSRIGPGTIQVSEAAHNRLRDRFLFRLRGTFYLPRVGSEQIFVLGGRQ